MSKGNILVTGASSGIGKAVAQYLDSVGYSIILVARNAASMQTIANDFQQPSLCVPYDLANLQEIESIFKTCKDAGMKLSGMVHCAGINRDQPVKVNNLDDMIQVMSINTMSFIELCKYFCSVKYSENGASIVAMSSTATIACDKSMCTYAASKAGVDAAARVMSKEFARRKIRVNTIQPSYVDTPMARSIDRFEEKVANQPLGIIQPEHVAYLVEFLLSDKSRYISGSNIRMSGAII